MDKKILIIDDEELICKTTSLLLQYSQFQTVTALNGRDGLLIAEKEMPDMILLDVNMPGMNGWDVLETLKANAALAQIPVIVFSAGDYAESEKLAKEKGAVAVCSKPFFPDELVKKIVAYLQ